MTRPRLLDLFSGAGGAAAGYIRAGFDVTGVDIKPQPRYLLSGASVFIQADAIDYCRAHGHKYDVIHASPPCQAYSSLSVINRRHERERPELIEPTRLALIETGAVYVIENVPGAPLTSPIRLCGSSFGLRVRRHRLFESNALLLAPTCNHKAQGRPVGVYGDHPESSPLANRHNGGGFQRAITIEQARHAMGIEWMEWREITQAIPPIYAETIGRQLLAAIESERAS